MASTRSRKAGSLLAWKLFLCIIIEAAVIQAQSDIEDPCSNFVCKWGGMCQTDSFGYPDCVCPLSCPQYSDGAVCSTYGMEFNSACELHRFACGHVISIALTNKGNCTKNESKVCPSVSHLLQFRDRYMEWIQIVKSSLSALSRRTHQLSISEKINVVKWEFKKHDHDTNGLLDDNETKVLLETMKYEPCGHGFVRSCAMVDGKPGINEEEWTICFNVAERPLYERRRLR